MWKELSADEEPKRWLAWSEHRGQWEKARLKAGVSSVSLAVVLLIFSFSLRKPLRELLCSKWTGGAGGKRRRETS